MRSYAFELLCSLWLVLAVQAGRGRVRAYVRGGAHAVYEGGYGRGYGGGYRHGKGGGYAGGYDDRHNGPSRNGGRHGGGRGYNGVPVPPTEECEPPCHESYSTPGQVICDCTGADPNDEIVDLPGLSFKPNFKHYSGYLRAFKTRFLYYWFVESQGSPSADPLVFWFNGGPGCSSLQGVLAESGPYLLSNDTRTLKKNPYSWNKLANVVYIESPAGVGFSYTTSGDDFVYNDNRTSSENYEAIKQFFAKFPQYRKSSVFIAGESYGGMYVPTLASRIIDGQAEFPIKLEGVAIGNGYLNADINYRSSVEFWYGHGFVDEGAFTALEKCCKSDITACDIGNECREEFSTRKSLPALDRGVPDCNPVFDPYLDKPEVRQALHIPDHIGDWHVCNETINVMYEFSLDMSLQIKQMVNNNVRVLLFYGDTDAVCNFLGGQKFAESIGLKKVVSKQQWTFDGRLGGLKTEYDKHFTFITVRGVGHMVPQWQPAGAEYFMRQFLKNEPI